jgi:hypothetical protein
LGNNPFFHGNPVKSLSCGIISGWNAAVLCGLRDFMRRRIFKVIRITVIAILVMFFTAFFAVRHPSVQTYLVQAITQKLSSDLGTEVSVQSVELDLFSRLVIRGLYVADQHKDTLVFVPAVRLRNYSFDRKTGNLSVRHAELQSPYFRLVRYEGETALNMAFIIDHFSRQRYPYFGCEDSQWTVQVPELQQRRRTGGY